MPTAEVGRGVAGVLSLLCPQLAQREGCTEWGGRVQVTYPSSAAQKGVCTSSRSHAPPSFAAPPPLLRAVTRQREGCEHNPGLVHMQDPCSPHLLRATCACRPAYGTMHAWHTKGGARRGLARGTTRGCAHTQCGWGAASLRCPGSHVALGSCTASLYAHGSRAKG